MKSKIRKRIKSKSMSKSRTEWPRVHKILLLLLILLLIIFLILIFLLILLFFHHREMILINPRP